MWPGYGVRADQWAPRTRCQEEHKDFWPDRIHSELVVKASGHLAADIAEGTNLPETQFQLEQAL
jgi:hypothetical protein